RLCTHTYYLRSPAFFFFLVGLPPRPTLVPYTTLFRSRMRPLTLLRAKPVLPVLNRPLLHWTLELLARPVQQRPVEHGQHGLRPRSEEHTSELQSRSDLVCRLLLEKKKTMTQHSYALPR